MFELIYTATPKGLLQGRSGFTTVAMTKGFPPNLIPAIENMSGFRNLYMPGDPHAADNPVNCAYQQLRFGSSVLRVVSQIEYAGLSYTGRSNTLAHHYVFGAGDPLWAMCSPASLLLDAANFPPWQGDPRLLPEKTQLAAAPLPAGCTAWERLTGFADWGKVIAEMVKRKIAPAVVLQFSPLHHRKEDLLALIAEVSAQLTPEERADLTFSTYCYQSAIGNPVFLRAYPENSTLLESIRYLHQEHVVVLGEKNEIPEKFQELLRQPKLSEPPPPLRETKPVKPVVQSPVLPKKPRKSFPAPSVAMPQKSATAPSSHRFWWIGGISAALLLILLGSFAAAYYAWQAKHPTASAPPVVVEPAAKPAVAPPPVKKTNVISQKPRPKPAPVKVEAVKKPVVTVEEWFEFYLALHSGKKEIALPKALKNGVLKRVALKNEYGVPPEKVGKIFAVSNNAIAICGTKEDFTSEGVLLLKPDSEKISLALQVKDGMLSVDPAGKADEIVSLDFSIENHLFSFQNEFSDDHWNLVIPRIKIYSDWKINKLYLRAECTENPFVKSKIPECLQWQVTTDAGISCYPVSPDTHDKITIPQLTELEILLQKRRACKDVIKRKNVAKEIPEPELYSPEMEVILADHYSNSADKKAIVQKIRKRQLTDEDLEKLKDEICTYIYQHNSSGLEKDWKPAQGKVRLLIAQYQNNRKKYAEYQKQQQVFDKQIVAAKKALSEQQSRVMQYPWCNEILKKSAKMSDDDLRNAIVKKYQKKTQLKLVRKSKK